MVITYIIIFIKKEMKQILFMILGIYFIQSNIFYLLFLLNLLSNELNKYLNILLFIIFNTTHNNINI